MCEKSEPCEKTSIKIRAKTPANGIAGRRGEFENGPSLVIWPSKYVQQHCSTLQFRGHAKISEGTRETITLRFVCSATSKGGRLEESKDIC